MKLGLVASVALIRLLVAADPAGATAAQATQPRREIAIAGEVVETGCFVMADRRGERHRQCAAQCARNGQPLGIFDAKTSTLYLAVFDRTETTPENPLLAHIAERVEVRGTIVERGGVKGIVVRTVRALGKPRESSGK